MIHESRLFLNHLDPVPVPENPSIDQARQALAVLMHPFERFPFASPMDRAALLAALLTAVERPRCLPLRPSGLTHQRTRIRENAAGVLCWRTGDGWAGGSEAAHRWTR